MSTDPGFQVRFSDGEVETVDSLWGARHAVARRVAFDTDPLRPRNALPAEIYRLDARVFGGRVFVERIDSAADLSPGG